MNAVIEIQPRPDEQLELITDGTRRRLLFALLDDTPGDTPIKISDRVGDTATAEWVEMHHIHLPKLEDYGVVRWDRENQLLRQGSQFDEIEPLLTVLDDHADELPDEWL